MTNENVTNTRQKYAVAVDPILAIDSESNIAAEVTLGVSLLVALEVAGKQTLASGCRNGGCGVCRVRIVSGTYSKGKMSRKFVTVEEEHNGLALACRIFPTSQLIYHRDPLKQTVEAI